MIKEYGVRWPCVADPWLGTFNKLHTPGAADALDWGQPPSKLGPTWQLQIWVKIVLVLTQFKDSICYTILHNFIIFLRQAYWTLQKHICILDEKGLSGVLMPFLGCRPISLGANSL